MTIIDEENANSEASDRLMNPKKVRFIENQSEFDIEYNSDYQPSLSQVEQAEEIIDQIQDYDDKNENIKLLYTKIDDLNEIIHRNFLKIEKDILDESK